MITKKHEYAYQTKRDTPLEGKKMHYIPKYSRERQNERQSQKFVTVINEKRMIKLNPYEFYRVIMRDHR